jgi:hypothetical protein
MKVRKIEEFCNKYEITIEQFYGREIIEGDLFLNSLTTIPEGFNPTVGYNLYLDSLTSIPKGFSPTVGGSLYLDSLTTIPKGFNPTVGGNLFLISVTSIPVGFNSTTGGDLILSSVTSIPKGFNPTVGGNLILSSVTSIPKGFNPTTGGSLFLNSLTSIPKGFNPTVGWSLFLHRLKSIPKGFNINNYQNKEILLISWDTSNGQYIKVDDIFSKVLSHKGNVWKLSNINSNRIYYLVTDGNNNYSHGDTIKEAKEDLLFKISKRDKSEYKGMDTNTKLNFIDAITLYRTITGACSHGVSDFIKTNNIKRKKYSIKEIINITDGNYGSKDLVNFFK